MKILLYDIRVKLELNMDQIALLTGISRSTLYRYERQDGDPTIGNLERIAKGLGIGIEDLYDSTFKNRKN